MGQLGFFDADKRLAAISAKGDPLEVIDRVVPFESFRTEIEAVVLTPAKDKKSNAGRKPTDVIVMFRIRDKEGTCSAQKSTVLFAVCVRHVLLVMRKAAYVSGLREQKLVLCAWR
jgi:hypothetical protein